MPQLTIDEFGIGIDTRRGPNVSDANRLRVCTNALITNGKAIRKRPGLRHDLELGSGTAGLAAGNSELVTFSSGASAVTHSNTPVSGKTYADKLLEPDASTAYASIPARANSTGYSVGDLVKTSTEPTRRYRCVTAGTSAGSEPAAFGTTTLIGSTITDGTVEWRLEYADAPGTTFSTTVDKIWFATIMNGFWTVIAEDDAGERRLFYINGDDPNEVNDINCPLNQATPPARPTAAKLASRIFMGNFELVNYCAIDEPRDWTELSDEGAGAGFLPVGRQALGADEVLALGQYQGDLIALFEDTAQSWNVDAAEDFNAFQQSIDGVGSRYPLSVDNLASDTFFLSTSGFRSISLLSLTNNLADVDVGTAIEDLVRDTLDGFTGEPVAEFYAKDGQYVCVLEDEAFVYTFSRTAKVSAWSKYTWGVNVTDIASLDSELFLRAGDDVYYLDDTLYQDETDASHAGENFQVDVEMAFLDFKKPGKLKYVWGFDIAGEGECEVAFKYEYYPAEWEADTAYSVGDYVRPNEMNGRRFRCTTAGTTGSSEPTWNTTIGGTTNDGTAVWTAEIDAPVEGQTEWQTVYGLTRPGEIFPVELLTTQVAPVFRVNTDASWRLDAITLHYEVYGEQH